MAEEKVEPVVEDDKPTTEDTPTPEQQLETLQTTNKELAERVAKAESSVQGLRGSLTEKDRKLSEQAGIVGLRQEMADMRDSNKLLAAMLAERDVTENIDDLSPKDKQGYLKKFEDLEQKQEAKRKADEVETQRKVYNQRADELFTRAKSAFKDDDESLEKVEDLLYAGRFERAEAKVAKAESTSESKKETDEEIYERVNQKKLKDADLLKTDRGTPSGGSLDDAAFKKGIGDGGLPLNKENMKRAKSMGLV